MTSNEARPGGELGPGDRPVSRNTTTVAPADLPTHSLADAPSAWQLQLPKSEMLVIFADGYGREGGELVYSLVLATRPPTLFDVVAGPLELLDDVYTDDPEVLAADEFDWAGAADVEFSAVPGTWFVALADGNVLEVRANEHVERDGEHLFTLSVRREGPGLPVLLVSDSLVTSVRRVVPDTPA